MPVYKINLIREQVQPPARRKTIYWGMLLYVGLCGGLLAAVANGTAKRMVRANDATRVAALLEREFRENHPGQKDLIAYTEQVGERLEAAVLTLDQVRGVLGERPDATRILLELMIPLPHELTINNILIDRRKNEIRFDLLVPMDKPEHTRAASRLLAYWSESAGLAGKVQQLQSVSRKREIVSGNEVMTLVVVGQLAKGGT